MRLGIFGGSFNPVHLGHLIAAECCRESGALDRVSFLPAAAPPHKPPHQLADARHRVEMLRLAIAGHPDFDICEAEIERGGISYTHDTLETIRARHPEAQLFLIVGADTLEDLPNWRDPIRVCQLAQLVVVRRAAATLAWEPLERLLDAAHVPRPQRRVVDMPRIEISSSRLRQAVAAGRSIRYQTPRAVEKYIETHGLYRNP